MMSSIACIAYVTNNAHGFVHGRHWWWWGFENAAGCCGEPPCAAAALLQATPSPPTAHPTRSSRLPPRLGTPQAPAAAAAPARPRSQRHISAARAWPRLSWAPPPWPLPSPAWHRPWARASWLPPSWSRESTAGPAEPARHPTGSMTAGRGAPSRQLPAGRHACRVRSIPAHATPPPPTALPCKVQPERFQTGSATGARCMALLALLGARRAAGMLSREAAW